MRALCDGAGLADFAIHFDASMSSAAVLSASRAAEQSLQKSGCVPSDVIPIAREHVTYRGVTLTHNIISGLSALLLSGRPLDFIVNLSASDYPTARPALMRRLLGGAVGRRLSFIDWESPLLWKKFDLDRFQRAHIDTALAGAREGRRWRTKFKSPLAKWAAFEVAKSSSWFIFSRELAEHLAQGAIPRLMLSAFALSDTADEHYFASVVHANEYFRKRTVPDHFRGVFFFAPNGTESIQHPFYVDETDATGEPVFWGPLLKRPRFFMRKVGASGTFTDRVDRRLLGLGNITEADRVARTRYEESLIRQFDETVALHLAQNADVLEQPPFRSAFSPRASDR